MNSTVLIAILVAAALGVNFFLKAHPAVIAGVLRRLSAWAVIGLGSFMMLRGQFAVAGVLLAGGLFLLRRSGGLPGGGSSASRSGGQRSHVRTRHLSMELDHDTGQMDGEVLTGEAAGRLLSDLNPEELIVVYRECVSEGPQSAALMEAYLDRAHPEWRETEGVSEDSSDRAHSSGAAMTTNEALDILGLPYGAGEEDIRTAHRTLMKRFHPDQGGSSYLASKINQAKDLLLE